ncbi:EscU/YscU/HrcU family type III secretion system export apparatus switch protein [Stenotrophomonas sp.]|uniref:EscU/YscU/HrcU family type III secretion system export apparatus switch protein n=1 Tax=Stenotrophomonas sp. TaxID=69392 RepID=UPI002FCAC8C2
MKTEKPTPHRLLKESRKGKSFTSKDLSALAVLLAGGIALLAFTSTAALHRFYGGLVARGFDIGVAEAAVQATEALLWMTVPVAVACIVAAVLVSLVQSRGVIANEALRIDLARLNPVNGFRNLFSLKVVKGALMACLYLLLGAVFVVAAWQLFAPAIFAQVRLPPGQAGGVWQSVAGKASALLLALLSPVALGAAFLDFRLYIRELRMDKSEVKQENKDNNGNPEIKQKRRQINEELSAQVQSDVAGSSLVLANPTHIAVGLYLHPDYPGLQFVSVRETGARALAVIALAERSGVPVVRDIPLARAIHARVRRYHFVPADLTVRVARILQWLRDIELARAPLPPDAAGAPDAPADADALDPTAPPTPPVPGAAPP